MQVQNNQREELPGTDYRTTLVRKKSLSRHLFSSLRWEYQTNIGVPLFTQYELENYPLRWLKNVLLERVGLTTQAELDRAIRRFTMKDIEKAQSECQTILNDAPNRIMMFLKVVFFDRPGQLPNYLIHSPDEIQAAFNFAQKYSHEAQEIWLCRLNVADTGSNFAGRILFPHRDEFKPEVLEMVWFSGPRKIDEFQEIDFPFPFLNSYKHPGSLKFSINQLYIPHTYLRKPNVRSQLVNDFRAALASLHYCSENINTLCSVLYGAGAKEVCVEFAASLGRFSVIDWDIETLIFA